MEKTFTAQAAVLHCHKHQNEEIDLYCKQCREPICSECARTDHLGHDIETIASWSRKLINNRDGFLSDVRSTFASQKKRKDRIVRETKCRNATLLKKKLKSLEKKRDEMHKTVDKLIDQQKTECKLYSDKLSKDVKHLEKTFKKEEGEIVKMLDTFEKTTTKGLDIIEYYDKLCSRVNLMEIQRFSEYYDRQVYQKGAVDSDQLKQMIGSVKETTSAPKLTENSPAFTYKNGRVHTIRPISSDKAWITYMDENEFALLHESGNCIRSAKKYSQGHSSVMTKNKSFVHVDFDKQIVLKIDRSGETSIIAKTAPLHPFQVGEALDGNILVILVDEVSGTRNPQSQRKVQMLTLGGQTLHTYEFGEDGSTPVITGPFKPTQNYNSNVCILDEYQTQGRTKSDRGKVFVFYEDGDLKFTYNGHGADFRPFDLCCDAFCNIICGNWFDDTVHIIDSEGTFLAFLLKWGTCIADPRSLGLHSDALWVGSKNGEVAVYRYNY